MSNTKCFISLIVSTEISTITESTASSDATTDTHYTTPEDKRTAVELSKSLQGKGSL